MSVKVIIGEDSSFNVDAHGVTTLNRTMIVEAESLMEIATSNVIPQRGARHPDNTAFYLDTIDISPIGNKNRKIQARASLVYNNSAELLKEFHEDPWDLGAQNFNSSYQPVTIPFISGYNENGDIIQNINSAGCRIAAETNKFIREITFTYCVKGRANRDFEGAEEPVINKKTTKVAGVSIKAMTGLLLPQNATFITEYEETGDKIKRQYWEVSTTIQINKDGWSKDELDVGTMAFFKDRSGNIVKKPRNIFSYTPWTSKDSSENLSISPKFGPIEDVISAKKTYAFSVSGYDPYSGNPAPSEEAPQIYQQAFDEMPYSEVTEPLPLTREGLLYEEAMGDPASYPYNTIKIFDTKIASWDSFDLPRDRI